MVDAELVIVETVAVAFDVAVVVTGVTLESELVMRPSSSSSSSSAEKDNISRERHLSTLRVVHRNQESLDATRRAFGGRSFRGARSPLGFQVTPGGRRTRSKKTIKEPTTTPGSYRDTSLYKASTRHSFHEHRTQRHAKKKRVESAVLVMKSEKEKV